MKHFLLVTTAAAIALSACDSKKPNAAATPTPTPGETTVEQLTRKAKEAAEATARAAGKVSEQASEAARAAEPKLREAADNAGDAARNAGEKIKEASGGALESLQGVAEAAREKVHEATAPESSVTPTPTATPAGTIPSNSNP